MPNADRSRKNERLVEDEGYFIEGRPWQRLVSDSSFLPPDGTPQASLRMGLTLRYGLRGPNANTSVAKLQGSLLLETNPSGIQMDRPPKLAGLPVSDPRREP
jgi:hypothetical protein